MSPDDRLPDLTQPIHAHSDRELDDLFVLLQMRAEDAEEEGFEEYAAAMRDAAELVDHHLRPDQLH